MKRKEIKDSDWLIFCFVTCYTRICFRSKNFYFSGLKRSHIH